MRRTCYALLMCVCLSGIAEAQGLAVFDTVFTPVNYPDGVLVATVHMPQSPNGVAVVLVHSLGSTRASMTIWCDTLAAHGYMAMTIDYPDPLNAGATYPSPVRAVKTAVEFIRRNAVRLGVTSGRVAALGQSLGAGTLAETVIADNEDAYFGTDPTIDDHLTAAALLYGIYDFDHYTQTTLPISIATFANLYFQSNATARAAGSCMRHIANITTPLALFHGATDHVLQYQQTQELYDSLTANGKTAFLHLYPSQGHLFDVVTGFSAFTSIGLQVKDSVLKFFEKETGPKTDVAPEITPASVSLAAAYPNPATSTSWLHFTLPSRSVVEITIMDVLGRPVSTVTNGVRGAGEHVVPMQTSQLPAGIYWCRLKADGASLMSSLRIVR